MITVSNAAFEEMTKTIEELEVLTGKANLNAQETRRHSFLLAKLSALKAGASPSQLREHERETLLKQAGLSRMPEQPRTRMAEDIQQEYRDFLSGKSVRTGRVPSDQEVRANEAGTQALSYTEKTVGGAFVPTGFWDRFSAVLKQADDVFQPWASNYLETETGSTCPLPIVDDTSNSSSLVSETTQSTEADVANFAQQQLNAWTFRSGYVALSLELIQDSAFPLGPVIDSLMAQRHARGVGAKLIGGTGIDQPTGLLTAVAASGVSPVIANGSSSNDGSANTGSNSIGTQDLNKAFFGINAMYRRGAIWYMSDSTLSSIAGLLDKVGHPLVNIVTGVDFVTDAVKDFYFLMGHRVAICPSMPSLGSATSPIVFGNPQYFVFRSVPSSAYLRMFKEAGNGTIEFILKGLVAVESFFRADSNALIANSQQSPFSWIQCHS
jgi:HK97 family phage major capsid protein